MREATRYLDVYRVRFSTGRVVAARVPFNDHIPETHAKRRAVEILRARGEPSPGTPVSVEFVRREENYPRCIQVVHFSPAGFKECGQRGLERNDLKPSWVVLCDPHYRYVKRCVSGEQLPWPPSKAVQA